MYSVSLSEPWELVSHQFTFLRSQLIGFFFPGFGIANYLPLLAHLRQTLKAAHKKSYTISVGKINPSKLGNFMEIECWVWVACSESMIDSKVRH